MNKDEKILEEYFGKKQPFQVPDGYFDDFASKFMENLPEKQTSEKNVKVVKMQPNLWKRLRPALLAACLLAAVFGVGIYINNSNDLSANNAHATKTAVSEVSSTGGSYSSFEAAADYTMLDSEEMYAMMTECY
jgi:hypothetical protein